jgi:hypothetical protein
MPVQHSHRPNQAERLDFAGCIAWLFAVMIKPGRLLFHFHGSRGRGFETVVNVSMKSSNWVSF